MIARMPRSVKDSDDDFEPKAATSRMQTRMLAMSSPLRRSSRIKQNKYSPGSESDNSNSQMTRTKTQTMDSTVSDMKKLRNRKLSISSDISELDIDTPQTPGKRTTRQSASVTPTRVNTRAASKRFIRAVSETQSPLSVARITRKTRASSIDPESLFDQNKSRSDSPIKTRRQVSMLSSSSLIKEQIKSEDRIPYVRLDATIIETDEITSSGNSNSSLDKALYLLQNPKIKKYQSTGDDLEEDDSYGKIEISIDPSKDETLKLVEKNDKTQSEDMNRAMRNIENIFTEEQYKLEKTSPSDNNIIDQISTSSSSSHQNFAKEDKMKIVKESLSDIEESLINLRESTKSLKNVPENSLDIFTEEEKKEIEILNINSDMSIEKNMPNVTSCNKSLDSSFMNKSSESFIMENEIKSVEKKLSKRRRSRESTEIAMKHDDLSKKADNSQEKMDISIESSDLTATVSLQHDSTKLDKITNKNETSIENINTSTNEDTIEMTSESDKIDKEFTVADNKSSNKIESDKEDKTSHSSISLVKSTQLENTDDDRENFTSILTIDNNDTDNNEIKLILEERSPGRNENEVSSNLTHSESNQSIDLQISSPINESSDNRTTAVQDKVMDSSDSVEEKRENLSKHVMESTSKSWNIILESNNFAHDDDSNNVIIQEVQSSDAIEISKKSAMVMSPEKTDAKDTLLKKTVKRNLKQKSSDVDDFERKNGNLQMETSEEDQENIKDADDISDADNIDLFQDIPIDKWKKKSDVKIDSMQSTSQMENDETECDLILVNKQAWLAAEITKAEKEAESFEYDSSDTVLLKSRLDATQTSCNENLDIVDEEFLMDIDSDASEKQVKKQKSKTKRRLTSEIDQDSSTEIENNLVTTDKSFNELKTTLNRTDDQFMSKLNKSEQYAKTNRRFSKSSNESDKEIENDASKLNRSSVINKKNKFLLKSLERRASLNESSKDTSMQNISANKSLRTKKDSEKELDNTDVHIRKKLYKKKHSLNKSRKDADDNEIESKKNNMSPEDSNEKDENISLNCSVNQESKSIDTKTVTHLNNDESDNSDINIVPMDFESKTYSMIVNAESDSSDQDELEIPSYLFARLNSDNDTNDSSSDSDINREYNLDGIKPKFSDEDVLADECRTSEVEFSDSDDNGSDLADFIVDDDDVETEKKYDVETEKEDDVEIEKEDDVETEKEDDIETEKEDDIETEEENDDEEDMHNMKEDDESENEKNIEENDEVAHEEEDEEVKQVVHNTTEYSINMEDDNEDIQKKDYESDREEDAKENKFARMEAISLYTSISNKRSKKIHESKNKSVEYISPRRSDTEMKQDIKIKKSNTEKNEKTLLDSSNSDLSIKKKKKSLMEGDGTMIWLDASNLTSSSTKKEQNSDPQYFSRDGVKRNSNEQLDECEFLSAKKLSKSCKLMKFSTPNRNSCKKLELDEIFKRISENEDIHSDSTIKATYITLKEKSKKDPILNEDINLKQFKYANKEKMSNNDFSPDLMKLLERTNTSKSTSSKKKLHKTMNIVDTETPTIKHLRKEKLNESVPILKSNAESSLCRKKLSTEKDTAQIKIKEKNNKEIPDLIMLSSDDAIQKDSQKKQEKYKKQEILKENIDEVLSTDAIELNISKKKKPIKLTRLIVVDDNNHENAYNINEKKKKKKKQNISKENTDKALSEDAVELKIPKKKKPVKFTQLNDNVHEDVCQINEKKKKKKQETSRENVTDEALSEDAQLKILKKKPVKFSQLTIIDDNIHKDALISKKKEKKKKKQEISKEDIDEILSEDVELKISKKKKRIEFIQSSIVEDNTHEDTCQINKKEKQKKKQETLKENIAEEALFEDVAELKIPLKKKKKCAQLSQTIMEDNCKSAYHINEKKKKKRKEKTPKENITEKILSENVVELKISKKKKCADFNQLAGIQNNTREDSCQINEKEKKNKKQINVGEDEHVNEDNILRKNNREKKELAQQKKNKIINSLKLNAPIDEHIIKKKKQQGTGENIETLQMKKKKNTLPVQIPVLKLKSNKNLLSRKLLRKTALDASESENVICTEKLDEVTAKMCIPKEFLKKKRDQIEDIEHLNIPTKRSKKEVKEVTKFLPSSSGLKRLSDDVIDNLADMSMKAKKKRKISRNEKHEEQVVSSTKNKSKMTSTDCDNLLNTSGCTTQFHVVNLQNTKKQSLKGAVAAASFRKRILARNNREPISTYMIYHDKMNFTK